MSIQISAADRRKFERIMDFWYDQEFFTPCWPDRKGIKEYRKEKPKYGRNDCMTVLPWTVPKEKPKATSSRARLYDLYFGRIKSSDVNTWLIRELDMPERFKPEQDREKSCIFALNLDEQGRYISESFTVCPMVWAICTLVRNQSQSLRLDHEEMRKFQGDMDRMIREDFGVLTEKPAESDVLEALYGEICKKIGLQTPMNSFVLRIGDRTVSKSTDPDGTETVSPATDILASFFLDDIRDIKKNPTDRIIRYVLAKTYREAAISRTDIEADHAAKASWLAADKFPLGMWPTPFSPTLMQQIGINIAISGEEDIFSVNGPPGTGKTTLLREVVADNIVRRASLMAQYTNPDLAFQAKSFFAPDGRTTGTYYIPDKKLCDYGILVASSNNTAVENVTTELPERIKEDRTGLFSTEKSAESSRNIYFGDIAANVIGKDCWGLVSAPLGKSNNRKHFVSSVWYTKNCNFQSYHKREDCPDWSEETAKFQEKLAQVQQDREYIREAQEFLAKQEKLKAAYEEARLREREMYAKRAHLSDAVANAWKVIRKQFAAGWPFQRPFDLAKKVLFTLLTFILMIFSIILLPFQYVRWYLKHQDSIYDRDVAGEELDLLDHDIRLAQERFGENFADAAFWSRLDNPEDTADSPAQIQKYRDGQLRSQKACPWTYKEYDCHREELFHQALRVHQAFFLNSEKARHNMGLMCDALNGKLTGADRANAYSHLFNSLLLTVPVVSTTFASVHSLLDGIGPEQLGLLIVDEAGQATPQSALGALWRFKRAILVGDPFQIEPVVTIPRTLRECLVYCFQPDPPYRSADISVQDLGDALNPYGGTRTVSDKKLWLGSPLVTHMRCIEPMFTLSNNIAYNGKMFSLTRPMPSSVHPVLQESCWLHYPGQEMGGAGERQDHSVREQTDVVIQIMDQAFHLEDRIPDIFVISPFRTVIQPVKDSLKRHLGEHYSHLFSSEPREGEEKPDQGESDSGLPTISTWVDSHCGTVHTFQGKQANEVLFVLGCDQNALRAAQWVGTKPNLTNVAITRAKYRLAVIGDMALWRKVPYVRDLCSQLPLISLADALAEPSGPERPLPENLLL